jgi:hypothetical protein
MRARGNWASSEFQAMQIGLTIKVFTADGVRICRETLAKYGATRSNAFPDIRALRCKRNMGARRSASVR